MRPSTTCLQSCHSCASQHSPISAQSTRPLQHHFASKGGARSNRPAKNADLTHLAAIAPTTSERPAAIIIAPKACQFIDGAAFGAAD